MTRLSYLLSPLSYLPTPLQAFPLRRASGMPRAKRKAAGARAMWKGTLQLGNTELPVKLYGAVQDQTIRFRLLHARDKTPVEQRMADPGSGKEVDPASIQRG